MQTSNNQLSASNNYGSNEWERQDELWVLAKKRASFKRSLVTYLAINTFFVALWYFTTGYGSYYWPVWPMIGWGFGILMQYFGAYHGSNFLTTEKEYEKLKDQQIR